MAIKGDYSTTAWYVGDFGKVEYRFLQGAEVKPLSPEDEKLFNGLRVQMVTPPEDMTTTEIIQALNDPDGWKKMRVLADGE